VSDETLSGDLAERVEALERKASWLQCWVVALTAALVGVAGACASGPQELTLRKLTITDDKGKPRMTASTDESGVSELWFWDRDGMGRIMAGTDSGGTAMLRFWDPHAIWVPKPRITIDTTPDGHASLMFLDRNGKPRIGVDTGNAVGGMTSGLPSPAGEPDSALASITFMDQNGKARIDVGTDSKDGVASLMVYDRLGRLTWEKMSQ